jgi:hypothetical protein
MSMFSGDSTTVVPKRLPLALFAVLSVVVFTLVAAAAFFWKYRQLPPMPAVVPPRATAKLIIHHPTFAPQRAWQEILAQSKSEVRDRLACESQHRGDATVASVSLSDLPRETLAPLVNVVASAFAQTCRSQWKVEAEQAYSAAQEKLREAQRQAAEADSRLESLRQRQNDAAAAPAGRSELPNVVMVDNPQWTEAVRRLAELEERRRVLLFERTPLHPSVQEIEMRITDMRREMAAIPPKTAQVVGPLPSVPRYSSLPAVMPADLDAAQQTAQILHRQVQQTEAAAQQALADRGVELCIDIAPAEALPDQPASNRSTAALLTTALAAAATSVIGLGMISFAASLTPAVSTVGELQALLPVPILGVVPATNATGNPTRTAARRRLARYYAVFLGLVTLICVAWMLLGA